MERNKIALFFMISLMLASLCAQAETGTADKLVITNTAMALPIGSNIKVRWVSPPNDTNAVAGASIYDLCFAVDSQGRPWIGYHGDTIINPVRQYRLKFHPTYNSLVCTPDGAMMVTTDADLCFVAPPKTLNLNYDNLPTAQYQPIANLPAPESMLFAGAGDCIYLVAPRKDFGSDVYIYKPQAVGSRGYIKIFSSNSAVSAVAGDGNSTFVAVGGVIAKIAGADGSVSKTYANSHEFVRGLEYYPGIGLFYCTESSIGFIGAKGRMQIMATPDARISLRNGTLYLLFAKSLGVLALDNIGDLKRFSRPIKETPVTSSKDVKLTSVRFFEAGKDVPEYADRKYSTQFDHSAARYIYCQVDTENLQYNKKSHKQTFTMELYRPGQDKPVQTENVAFDFKTDFSTMWGWARFGADEPGTIYPRSYTIRTYLNGTLLNESKFNITGEPDLIEAASHNDVSAVKKLTAAGADLNAATSTGYTPLMLAIYTSNKEIAKLLIDAGANVNAKATDGETALTIDADIYKDDSTITKMLLTAGAELNAPGADAKTALHRAVFWGKLTVVKLLLERGAKVDAKDKDGLTPLAASNLRYSMDEESTAKMVELLLANGADTEAKDTYGNTLLFNAVEGRNAAAVSVLIKRGANVNATGKSYGVTEHSVLGQALDNYSTFGSNRTDRMNLKEIARLLQAAGADFNNSEFARVYFRGIDQILDAQHMVRLLEMSESAARDFEPEDPYLRKADIRGILNAACRMISETKESFGYYGAALLLEDACERARKWGLISSCPEVYFNTGLVYIQAGNSTEARKYLKEYLDVAPTGSCAARARELMNQL